MSIPSLISAVLTSSADAQAADTTVANGGAEERTKAATDVCVRDTRRWGCARGVAEVVELGGGVDEAITSDVERYVHALTVDGSGVSSRYSQYGSAVSTDMGSRRWWHGGMDVAIRHAEAYGYRRRADCVHST